MKITAANITALANKPSDKPPGIAKSTKEQNPELLKLRKACREFESIFISYMLKSMRKASEKSDLFGKGLGSEMYSDLFDMKLSEEMAKSGQMKLGDILFSEYAPMVESKKAAMLKKAETAPSTTQVAIPNISVNEKQAPQEEKVLETIPAAIEKATDTIEATAATSLPDATDSEIMLPIPEILTNKNNSDKADETGLLAKFENLIFDAASKFGLNPALLKAVIVHESGGNPKAVSRDGAKGLMQLIDSTAKMMGVTDPFNPIENIMGGAKYLSQLMSRFGGDIDKAIASYNAGPGAVEKFNGIPPYKETREYVRRVKATFAQENESD